MFALLVCGLWFLFGCLWVAGCVYWSVGAYGRCLVAEFVFGGGFSWGLVVDVVVGVWQLICLLELLCL